MKLINRVLQKASKINKQLIKIKRSKNWDKYVRKYISHINNKHSIIRRHVMNNNCGGGGDEYKYICKYFSKYSKINPYYHMFYFQKTGIHDIRYIPDSLYYAYIDPYYNNWDEAHYIDNKCYYHLLFHDVKQPETIVFRCNGVWCTKDLRIMSFDDVKDILKSEHDFFLKLATESEGGHGVFYLKGSDENEWNNVIENTRDRDIIVQKPLHQSDILSKINPSSVNTIRVLSLLTKTEVKIYSTILRMGIHESKVDNASSGGITCGIDKTGRLKKYAYSVDGNRYDVHPDSKIHFDEIVIPQYSQIHEFVKFLHPRLPHFRLISWDIALDKNNVPVLIEANLKYGELDFHQLNNGPVFGDDTEIILNEVFGRKKET